MAQTPRLKLPLIDAAQAQKHVTHNEAVLALDLLTGIVPVLDRDLTAAPAAADGTVYMLGGAGTDAWDGYGAGDLALRIDGAWRRVLPSSGMVATIVDEAGLLLFYNGANWASLLGGVLVGGPRFSAEVNYDAYIPANAWTKVPFNNGHHNDQGAFVPASNWFLAPADGYYQFGANVTFKANGANPTAMQLGLAVGGTLVPSSVQAVTDLVTLVTTVTSSALLKLTLGQTVQAQIRFTTNDGYVEQLSNTFWGHVL